MNFHNIIYELMLVYTGAAVFSTLFLFLKQPIILSYIFLGMLIGPYGFGLINEADHVEKLQNMIDELNLRW